MAMNGAPVVPTWVSELVGKCNGYGIQLVMTKTLTSSDVNRQQNRLLIPKDCVAKNVPPMLTDEELALANLVVSGEQHDERNGAGGLDVRFFARNGFRFELKLKRWATTGSTVINGPEWTAARELGALREKDVVEMWAFRDGEGKLCFAIGKK